MDRLKLLTLTVAACAALLALTPASASACAVDDTNWFESFFDASCLGAQSNTTLDAQGGVRLTTNGAAQSASWDDDAQFDNGVTHESLTVPPVAVSTLERTGTGAGAELVLPDSNMPLDRDAAAPFSPPLAATGDNDNVADPSVIKVGATYYMYFAGTAENSSVAKIFRASSPDGQQWTRDNAGAPVLSPGVAGSFDEQGVSGPEVIYDAGDAAAPYKMWFAGAGSVYGGIGYATSTDGLSWTKFTDGGPVAVPVLDHGLAGSPDSFAAADPSVIKDGTTWKMWYTADDSNVKKVAYATSADGTTWSKGGKVIAPTDPGASANIEFGAYAPSVIKTAPDQYEMLLVGRKLTSGSYLDGEFETKIMNSSSSDGITWSGPSPSLNPSGTNSKFDFSNLDGPDVFADTGATPAYKGYYAGNTLDTNGNFHTRIGYATSNNGTSFSKVTSGPGVASDSSVLGISALGTAFDARAVGGMSAAAPAGALAAKKFVGFYAGVRGQDFKSRIGGATSPDGSAWTRMSDGASTGGSLLPLGNAPGNFDLGGQRDPSVLYDSAAGSPYRVYFTAVSNTGVTSIGTAATTQDADKQPVNSGWSTPAQISLGGAGCSTTGVSHPVVIKDGATYRMFFSQAGTIKRTESASATSFAGACTTVFSAGTGFEAAGVKDPVVWQPGAGDYRMVYTGSALENGKPVDRLAYATSVNGTTWTRQGLVLNPGQDPYSFDEKGISPSGVALDGASPHIWYSGTDRAGRTRGGHATLSAETTIPDGSSTYQLGDYSTSVRDFREVARSSSGDVTLWMSFLQPYSSAGNEYWSAYFPVTVDDNPETLNFLLNIRGVRWQARLSDPASSPSLDSVSLDHAPVSFNTSGSATTTAVAPPPSVSTSSWSEAVVTSTNFQPNGGGTASATAQVLDATTSMPLASAPVNLAGTTTIDLSAVSATDHPSLKVAFTLTSDGAASPIINSLQVKFNAAAVPVVTLAASAASTVYGTAVTLSGNASQGGAPLAGKTIQIAGAGTATTDALGNFSLAVTPDRLTTYTAKFGAGTSAPVTVAVAELVKLTVRRKGTKATARGSVAPLHAGEVVQLQQKKGSRWVTIKKPKTGSTSAFSATVTKLKPTAKYQFRALTPGDALHLSGTSAIAYVDPFKVSLTAKASGKTVAFSGKVSPARAGKYVTVKVLKGTVWSTLAKVKLSSRSTFSLKKKLASGSYRFRADFPGDRRYWPGKSAERAVVIP